MAIEILKREGNILTVSKDGGEPIQVMVSPKPRPSTSDRKPVKVSTVPRDVILRVMDREPVHDRKPTIMERIRSWFVDLFPSRGDA